MIPQKSIIKLIVIKSAKKKQKYIYICMYIYIHVYKHFIRFDLFLKEKWGKIEFPLLFVWIDKLWYKKIYLQTFANYFADKTKYKIIILIFLFIANNFETAK